MANLVIAIDPDVDKSGIAVLQKDGREVSMSFVKVKSFFELLDSISDSMIEHLSTDKKCLLVVEAGWLNQITNFHGVSGRQGQRVAYQVGRNHQIGMLILEWAGRFPTIEAVAAKPLTKCWQGPDRKITHGELDRICSHLGITLPNKTNQEMRDAALLAITYSNLPIRL